MKKKLIIIKQHKIIYDYGNKFVKIESKIHKNKKHVFTIKDELKQLDYNDEYYSKSKKLFQNITIKKLSHHKQTTGYG